MGGSLHLFTMNIREALHPILSQSDSNASRPPLHVVVGFDGFVDEIIHVIGRRRPGGNGEVAGVERIDRIADFGGMIEAAAGRSLGREIQIIKVEGGGNGPNFADGMLALGASVDLYGTLGDPLHPAFASVASRCRTCTAVGDGFGRTLAFEFADGKLMLNETSRLASLDEAAMRRVIDAGEYRAACAAAQVVGLVNWSKYPHMTACWRLIQERVLASLTHRPWLLVDLADPAGRDAAELRDVLELLRGMQAFTRVVLGVNLHEAGVILGAFGDAKPSDEAGSMEGAAAAISRRLNVQLVVIHSQRRAAGAWNAGAGGGGVGNGGAVCIEGAYTDSPLRTTGVGDRFNAGLMYGLASGQGMESAIALGCAAGGYFVRHGLAGSRGEIQAWLGSVSF